MAAHEHDHFACRTIRRYCYRSEADSGETCRSWLQPSAITFQLAGITYGEIEAHRSVEVDSFPGLEFRVRPSGIQKATRAFALKSDANHV